MTFTYLGSFTGGTTTSFNLSSYPDYKKFGSKNIAFRNISAYAYGQMHWNTINSCNSSSIEITYNSSNGVLTLTGGKGAASTYNGDERTSYIEGAVTADVYLVTN